MPIYKPPRKIPEYHNIGFNARRRISIFLAGTIDMGNSEDWQEAFTQRLCDKFKDNIDIYNPRRDDWDSSWKQVSSDPQFKEQVLWELNAMEKCDYIVMHLAGGSASPVSMLETGVHLFGNKLMMHCEEGFYRKGNIDLTFEFYDKYQFRSMDKIFDELSKRIKI